MNIASSLAAAARTFGARPAVSVGTELKLHYAQLGTRVAQLAGALLAHGCQRGDRVGIAMHNCAQYFEVMYAIWHAGLCAVPLNAKLHPLELAFALENCSARVCFASAELAGALAHLPVPVPGLAFLIDVDAPAYAQLLAHPAIPVQDVEAEQAAWLFYTSGTTGKPKGAILTHRALQAMTWRYYADIDQVTDADCMLHAAPLSHGTGLYLLAHVAKASHQIIPASGGFDPAEIFALTQHYDNLTFFTVPTMLTRLVNHPQVGTARLAGIKTIFYGGAPMYLEDLKRALQVLGPRLVQIFGQGEMPNTITVLSKRMHNDTTQGNYDERLASVGIPRTGVEVRIVDEAGAQLPPGSIGEVIARSDVCMSGYWLNPQATAATLRNGWLFTGDIGVCSADGFLTLKDRSKDLIKSGGSNIYPREVEEVLLLHPQVREVSVIGVPHPDWGEEVVAFIVCAPATVIDIAALDSICLAHIARYKRPKHYHFLPELPKSSYGKVLKTELRKQLSPTGA